ncbi:CBS domain-containing protein [Clostridium beijerinckii]|nr:CBS domain-containing protein [Clostridium beijerinckii]
MNKNLYRVNILKKISEVQNTLYEENIDCSAVYNNETLVGILTLRDLVIVNPNCIVKDVMTNRYTCIDWKEYIWKLKEVYDSIDRIDSIFDL